MSKLGLKLDLSEWAAMLHCVWYGANIHEFNMHLVSCDLGTSRLLIRVSNRPSYD